MKKIFACAFLMGICSLPVFAVSSGNTRDNPLYDAEECDISFGRECRKIPRSPTLVLGCNGKNAGDKCVLAHGGKAEDAECMWIKKTPNANPELSCAALKCKDVVRINGRDVRQALWLAWDKKAKEWTSMGVCHPSTICNCGDCGEGGRCEPVYDISFEEGVNKIYSKVDGPMYNRCECVNESTGGGNACDGLTGNERACCIDLNGVKSGPQFDCCLKKKSGKPVKWTGSDCQCEDIAKQWDEESQNCVDKPEPCVYDLEEVITYTCPPSSCLVDEHTDVEIEIRKGTTFELPAGHTCDDVKNALISRDLINYPDILKKLCCEKTVPVPTKATQVGSLKPATVNVNNAVNAIDSWMAGLESSKSKWKDAAGNFNGARLASDLTAGVVLGTVGGVVSGVVIKKKQVEKGFEALNCYVGGQQMANWGDEFKVEFRRY